MTDDQKRDCESTEEIAACEPAQSSNDGDRATVVRQRLTSIGRAFKQFQIECAVLLVECHAGGYSMATHESFEAFVYELLGITLRTAQEWMKVIRACNAANVPISEIVELGWSKVAVVAGQLNRDNAQQLLKDVQNKSYAQLKKDIAEAKSATRTGTKRKKAAAKQIVMSAVMEDAIRRACMHTRQVEVEFNLDFIATKFMELYPPPSRVPLEPSLN